MAQSLGSLFVELKAETGGFVSALSKAAGEAQKASRQMSRDFSDLASVASQTFSGFGDFSPAISRLALALETAGSAASGAMKEFSKLRGAMGAFASLAAGVAAGVAALGIGAIGLAASTAESAAKMEELSQSTGLSAETLTRFGFVAKQVHIETEVMALALQRMSRSAFQAATALPGTSTAYSKLGVSVRDSTGQLKSSEALMLDLADRFSRMPDGIAKTALAMQIFGRAGAEMIPLLGEGRAGIDALMAEADRLGVTLSGSTLESAYQFSLKLGEIRAAADGAENTLMVQLLPALNAVAGAMAESAEKNSSSFRDFLVGIAALSKGILVVGDTLFTFMADAGATIGTDLAYWADAFVGFASVAKKALVFDFAGASAAYKDEIGRLKAIDKEGADSRAKIWADNTKFIQTVFGDLKPPAMAHPAGGALAQGQTGPGAPEAAHRPDVVAELVTRLQAQAAAELELATATEKSTAAALLSKAAAEAETKIGETRAQLLAQEKDLREQLADAKRQEAGGEASAGARALTLQAEISGIQKFLAELQKDTPQIKQFYAEIASGGFAAKASKDLDDFTSKTDRQTEALRQMAAAYTQGPAAVQRAQEAAKIAPFEETRSDLGETISGLKKIGAPAADIAKLQTSYDQLTAAIERAKISVAAFTSSEIDTDIKKRIAALGDESAGYRILASAAFASAAAQREAAASAEVEKYRAAHPGASASELRSLHDAVLGEKNDEYALSIRNEAAQDDLANSYQRQVKRLQEVREQLQSVGASTLLVDAQIYEAGIQASEQWDKAALSVGSIGEKFRAMVNEIELEGANLGEKFVGTLQKGIDDVSDSLAKFIVTGKSGFAELLNSMAESLLKSQIQWSFSKIFSGLFGGPKNAGAPGAQTGPGGTPGIVPGPLGIGGALAGAFGIKLPGAAGTAGPNGSSGSPFYVIIADSSGNPFGVGNALPITPQAVANASSAFSAWGHLSSSALGATPDQSDSSSSFMKSITGMFSSGGSSGGSGGGGLLGGLLSLGSSSSPGGRPSGTAADPIHVVSASGGSGGLLGALGGGGDSSSSSGGFASLMTLFEGFADGGMVSSGVPILVGEKRPEVFVPNQAGRIIPSIPEFMNSTRTNARLARMSSANIAGRAAGGSVLANSAYMVGEKRPEVFVPYSARSISAMGGGAGGAGHTTVNFSVNGVQDHDSFNRSKGQIYADLQQAMALAHYRNRGGF